MFYYHMCDVAHYALSGRCSFVAMATTVDEAPVCWIYSLKILTHCSAAATTRQYAAGTWEHLQINGRFLDVCNVLRCCSVLEWVDACNVLRCCSVLEWVDPYDSTVYCIKSDNSNSIVSGTSHHGVVRLWDKRHSGGDAVQLYYTASKHSRHSSPVYSLAFDCRHLYAALDLGVNVLDFSVYGTTNSAPA